MRGDERGDALALLEEPGFLRRAFVACLDRAEVQQPGIARRTGRARAKLPEADKLLLDAAVCEDPVDRSDHALGAAHRHRKLQVATAVARLEGVDVPAVNPEVRALAVDSLLIVPDE